MNKEELIKIFASLNIPFNEGIQNDKNTNVYPRIVFREIGWDPITASDTEYDTNVIYQVSFFSKKPRHEKLLNLREKLKEKKIRPYIEHEYIQEEKYFHSYFSVEVRENIGVS